ncbi:hypothetical protein, partial [Salmonella enterica]|uniref:hypothetical protein n=1 Tax=Salmonella enterica TaxID=28901 RepID=UPI003CF5270A
DMSTTVNNNGKIDVSPTLDTEISSVTAYQYFVNPVNTTAVINSEKFDSGLADARAISKKITLADSMDAEDF